MIFIIIPGWDLRIRDFDEISQTVIHIEFCWWGMYLYWQSAFNLPWLCSLAEPGQDEQAKDRQALMSLESLLMN